MTKFTYTKTKNFPNIKFLVGSRHSGLLYFDGEDFKRIYPRYRVYGITKGRHGWCAYVKDPGSKTGTIVSFNIEDDNFCNFKNIICPAPKDIHQIDFIGKSLILTDVRSGSLIEYKNFLKFTRPPLKIVHKIGTPMKHFNSIYFYNNQILVLAHNQYAKTEQKSKVIYLNKSFDKVKRYKSNAKCGHNIYQDKSCIIVCDSLGGNVLYNNKPILKNMGFVRGLSISDDYILIGSSKQSDDDKNRISLGHIHVFNRKFKKIGRISIPKTQIYEIRRVDSIDYCMSNGSSKNKVPLYVK